MKKLTALVVVLLGLTLLPSCQSQDTEDLEPITTEVVQLDEDAKGTEGEDDSSTNGGS